MTAEFFSKKVFEGYKQMEKKNLDWANLGFAYRPIDYRWQTRWHDGAWEEGGLTTDPDITLSEAACVSTIPSPASRV